ncbi:class I SAM-dependent methyltransferase [Roseateles saccharophilus]|uniref:class I SAM-dependent methyltransferase n=1 Tax=Roseateles saccharophilus TaxID=304 RepID=UPI00140552DE|nr:class I SAM-dependent methyltransferase [Roseateles saccharophilus]
MSALVLVRTALCVMPPESPAVHTDPTAELALRTATSRSEDDPVAPFCALPTSSPTPVLMPQAPNGRPPHDLPEDVTARFYDAVAARYDAQVDRRTDNLQVRLSFCERVASIAGPGGLILDFGCGTGIDAAWYAARGHRVVAYDISPAMVDVLRERCKSEIESGRVTPTAGPLAAMTNALEEAGQVAAIAANFAVLNHVRELKPLLQILASHLASGGALVACVLNPFYRRDMLQAWWWRNALRSFGKGAIQMSSNVTTYRHFVGAMRRAAGPEFVLEDVCAAGGSKLLGTLDSNFLFVVLRRLS